LKVGASTIRYWAGEYGSFLSDGATGRAHGARREFNDDDALVFATISQLRNEGKTPTEIADALHDGHRVDALPSAPTPEEREARESVALVAKPEYERALDRVRGLTEELEKARDERDRAIERWQTDTQSLIITHQGEVSKLNERIAELERQLGEAKGALAERLPMRTTLQIAAALLVGLLIFLALAVIYLSSRGGA
jgi:DNA-binding transcriptional MerR regulator